ncbi:8-oxoguanine DNA-glycosylase [Thozetella sp. PMI_491]|nr:8-oxoguanine DNA-glycosylase [Thozetella sp. PMI_491]
MSGVRVSDWRKLPLSLAELCIDTTLRCGQSFRWRKLGDEWHCALHGRLVSLKQDPTHLHYRAAWPAPSALSPAPVDDTAALVRSYFALSLSLESLYDQWSASDANFARRAGAFSGIRILNQDAWEALVGFICSSNNNIARIGQMVHKLCLHYGPYVGNVDGEAFHDFPPPAALAGDRVEAHLRTLGFGYRAKYIAETARVIADERPAGWLLSMRNPDWPPLGGPAYEGQEHKPTYRAAHDALLELTGVGPKVADCVCLMGLGWHEAIPVDTHVWQIAQRDYKFGKGVKTKTLSKVLYDAVGDHFRAIWGPQAGWAQSVLFTANLRSFADQASGKVEKVKVETAKVKMEEIVASGSTRTRKRRIVEAEVPLKREQVKEAVRTTRTSKRRRAGP